MQEPSPAGSDADATRYIDIGVNLTNKRFRQDVTNVIQSARTVGVDRMIVTGTSVRESLHAMQLCLSYPGMLYSTAGVHPHDAKSIMDDSAEKIIKLAEQDCVVAIGECGLDFNRDFSPRDKQLACFEMQLQLAADLGLPVFLHERDAHAAFVDLLGRYRDRLAGAVVHCFTGTAEEAKAYLALDVHLGITGWICDERRGQHLRDVVQQIPVERLMIETDAPYLAPRDIRPKIGRNEPKYLPHILGTIARCRGDDADVLGRGIVQTTERFFKLAT